MSLDGLTSFLTVFMHAADFVIRSVDEAHDWVVRWLPFCAARGFLHVIKEGGAVSGVAIAGPISSAKLLGTRRPGSILPDDFELEGDVLFGAYLFVDPARRGSGAGLDRFHELLTEARSKFPGARRFAYCRRGRLFVRDMPPIPVPQPAPAPVEPVAEPADDFQESAISTFGENEEEEAPHGFV